MKSIQMPKLPTEEEIRSMSYSKYQAYFDYLCNLSFQAIGASGAVVTDSFEIRKNNPEVRDFLDSLDKYYTDLIKELQDAMDWMFKVRYAIK